MTATLASIRANFSDALAAGSVTGATVQQLIDFISGTVGAKPTVSGLWQTGNEGFVPSLPGVLSTAPVFGATQATWPTANRIYGVRVVAPRACTIRDLAISVAVQSGNVSVAIYDTGDTVGGTYTALYRSSAVACPAAGSTWTIVADPNLSVYAGQQLIFALSCDNTTASFLKSSYLAVAQLPANFAPCAGGALPKPLILQNTAHPAPASITEANAVGTGNYVPLIIARYV